MGKFNLLVKTAMPHITTFLADEVGIQFQKAKDKTGSTGATPINNMMTGNFRRGDLHKPMTIHKGNIRAMLGYDPTNPDYVAVADALDTNIPSVQVMRLSAVAEQQEIGDFSYDLEYPPTGSLIGFRVNNINDPIGIMVDNVRLKGSMPQIMDKLAQDHGIYMSYVLPDILLFTVSSIRLNNVIAIKGVKSYIPDLAVAYPKVPLAFNLFDYCECHVTADQVFAFSLSRGRDKFYSLIDIPMELDQTVNVKYAESAVDAFNNNYLLTSVKLDHWYQNNTEINENTMITFTHIPHVPFGTVIAERHSNDLYADTYNNVVNDTFAMALEKYQGEYDDLRIYWHSSDGYIRARSPYYMDLTGTAVKGFVKGYPAYIGLPE